MFEQKFRRIDTLDGPPDGSHVEDPRIVAPGFLRLGQDGLDRVGEVFELGIQYGSQHP